MLCEREAEVLQALKGALVVLPAVAYANVGELAVDVLVSTLRPKPLGALESVNVLPAVGNDAYDVGPSTQPGTLSTALELFALEGSRLVLIQQRAPAALGCQAAFAAELAGWLAGAGAAGVLVLTGLDAQLRRDRQLDGSPFRFLASSDELRSALTSTAAGAQHLSPAGLGQPPSTPEPSDDPYHPHQQQQHDPSSSSLASAPLLELEAEVREEEQALHSALPPWPLLAACGAAGLPCAMLGCFVAEGDNAGEGMGLAGHALRVLSAAAAARLTGSAAAGLESGAATALRAPASWVGLYGRSFPREIF